MIVTLYLKYRRYTDKIQYKQKAGDKHGISKTNDAAQRTHGHGDPGEYVNERIQGGRSKLRPED